VERGELPCGLAFGSNGQLYTSAQVGNGGVSDLYRVDPATGAETLVGQTVTQPYFATDLGSCVLPAPDITVTKAVSPSGVVAPGATLTYNIAVTNVGDAAATDVRLADPIPANTTYVPGTTTLDGTPVADINGAMPYVTPQGANSPGALDGNIAPGDTATVTFEVTVDNPLSPSVTEIVNQGVTTYTGGPDQGVPSSPPDESAGLPPEPTDIEVDDPHIALVKSATSDGVPVTTTPSVGQQIDYAFAVTNTGNVTLTGVSVSETAFSGTGTLSAISCPSTSLAPAAQMTRTATYTVTQADVNAGVITNTAEAGGIPPHGPPVSSGPSQVTIPETQDPALAILKSATPATVEVAGNAVTYSFQVTNTGNVTLRDVTVHDTAFTGTGGTPVIDCPNDGASLAPGTTITCTARYTVT
jgi:uncharacterized repeat protein (TIGR01451 family)